MTESANLTAGEFAYVTVCKGATYTFSTCSNTGLLFDTELTLLDTNGVYLDYNDDDCGLTTATSEIIWLAQYSGRVKILLDETECAHSGNSATVDVTMETACNTDPVVLSPFTISSIVTDATCDGYSDGSIDLTVSGGLDFGAGTVNQDCRYTRPICGDSTYDVNSGSGHYYDVNSGSSCLEKEINSSWFEIRIGGSGNLAFTVTPENLGILNYALYDFDFAMYGPNPTCGSLGTPLRCSSHRLTSLASNRVTGLDAGELDTTEGNSFDDRGLPSNGLTKDINATAGESYYMLVNYPALSGLNTTAPDFDIEFTGSATLDCSFITEYTISWTGPNGFTASTEDISGLDSGQYIVRIEDHWGNIGFDTILVSDPDPLKITAVQNNNSCFETDDGSLALTVTGGTPPYNYSWSNGETTSTITNLTPGNYSVTVTDSQSCVETASYTTMEAPQVITPLIYHQ